MVTGMDIVLTDLGAGRTYLLLHGGGGPGTVAAFAALLGTHGRVVTPTHPGFAGSDRPDALDSPVALAARYVELLSELDLTEVCVVGNSLGGWVAAEIALQHSSRVSSVVLVDAVGIEVPEHPVPDFFALTVEEIGRRCWYDPTKMIDPTTLPPAVRATLPGNRAALTAYIGYGSDATLLGRLAGVTVPVLVLWGEADRMGDLDYGRAYAQAIPGARFQVLPHAGHLPQVETPEELLTHVVAFAGAPAAATTDVDTNALWQNEFTTETPLAPSTVWAVLVDLETGVIPLASGDGRALDGPFVVGGTITATPAGLSPLRSVILELHPEQAFATRTSFNGLVLTLRHTLQPTPGGGTHLTRQLQITGEDAEDQGHVAGPRISEDYPDALAEIITTAQNRA